MEFRILTSKISPGSFVSSNFPIKICMIFTLIKVFLVFILVLGSLSWRESFYTLGKVHFTLHESFRARQKGAQAITKDLKNLNLICISCQNQNRIKKYEDVCETQLIFIRRLQWGEKVKEGKKETLHSLTELCKHFLFLLQK